MSFLCLWCSLLVHCLGSSHSNSNSSAHHGVVAHAQEAHHLHVCGDGGRACELSVGVHTAHGIGHAVGSGAISPERTLFLHKLDRLI